MLWNKEYQMKTPKYGSYGLGTTQNTEATINRISYINKTNGGGLLRNNVAITKPNYEVTRTTLY